MAAGSAGTVVGQIANGHDVGLLAGGLIVFLALITLLFFYVSRPVEAVQVPGVKLSRVRRRS